MIKKPILGIIGGSGLYKLSNLKNKNGFPSYPIWETIT